MLGKRAKAVSKAISTKSSYRRELERGEMESQRVEFGKVKEVRSARERKKVRKRDRAGDIMKLSEKGAIESRVRERMQEKQLESEDARYVHQR